MTVAISNDRYFCTCNTKSKSIEERISDLEAEIRILKTSMNSTLTQRKMIQTYECEKGK
jgi:hypothetical protein